MHHNVLFLRDDPDVNLRELTDRLVVKEIHKMIIRVKPLMTIDYLPFSVVVYRCQEGPCTLLTGSNSVRENVIKTVKLERTV